MSKEEKLIVQLFERKNWIIEQVRQQTDLYEQHFVSKLLIQGIKPPPWFRNPNFNSTSSDPKELNKEELISDLLLPHARLTFPCTTGEFYLHNKIVGTGDNTEFLDGLANDIQDSNKDPDADEQRPMHEFHGSDIRYTSSHVPQGAYTSSHDQEDVRSSSLCIKSDQSPGRSQRSQPVVKQNSGKISDGPHCCDANPRWISNSVLKRSTPNQTDTRISSINTAPDQSLARFQRSKSRQKALELRTSEKAAGKSHLSHENKTFSYSGVALYGIDPKEPDNCKDLLIMVKSSDINRGSSVERGADRGDQQNKSGTSNNCGSRITRSISASKWPSSVNEPLEVNGSRENANEDSKEDCLKTEAEGLDPGMGNGTSCYSGEIVRNNSCVQHSSLNESVKIGRSSLPDCNDDVELAECMDIDNQLVSEVMELGIAFCGSRENSGEQEAAGGKSEVREQESSKFVGRMMRSQSSRQQSSYANDFGLAASPCIPEVDGSTHYETSGESNQQLHKVNEVLEVVKPLTEVDGNVKRFEKTCGNEGPVSKVGSSAHSKSDAPGKYPLVSSLSRSDRNDLSARLFILADAKTTSVVNQEKEVTSAMAIELNDQPPCFTSTLDSVNLGTELESVAVRFGSDAHIVVKPKQLDFGSMEDCSLNENIIKRSLKQSSQRLCSMKPAASLENSMSDYPSKVSMQKQLMVQSAASAETENAQRPLEANTEECNQNERSTLEPYTNEKLKIIHAEDDSEDVCIHDNSLGEKYVSSLDFARSSMHHPDCHLMEGCHTLHIDENHFCCERLNKSKIIPLTSHQQYSGSSIVSSLTKVATGDSKHYIDKEVDEANPPDQVLDARQTISVDDENNMLPFEHKSDCENTENMVGTEKTGLMEGNSYLVEGGLGTHGSVEYIRCVGKITCSLEFKETQPTYMSPLPVNRPVYAKVDSWPRFKRRKIEDQQTNCFFSSPSFRVRKLYNIQGAHISSSSKSIENKLDAVSKSQSLTFSHKRNASECSDIIYEKMEGQLTDGAYLPPSPIIQQEEGRNGSEEQIKVAETPSTSVHEELEPNSMSSKQTARYSQGLFLEDAITDMHYEQEFQKFFGVGSVDDQANADLLTSTGSTLLVRNSQLLEAGPVASPSSNDLALDQDLTAYEGFIQNEHAEKGRLATSIGGINFDRLNSTCNSMQQASTQKQTCRTASMPTPLPHFSSKYKSLKNKDLYSSVPNGLLEHVDISALSFTDDAGNYLRATSANEVVSPMLEVLYSDLLPYSAARYGWNSKISDTPLGKYRERNSSSSFSSGKRFSFNPEHTCFPIEEDPNIEGENENVDEDNDNIQEDKVLREINSCANTEPLLEKTEVIPNPPATISAAERSRNIGGLESIDTEVPSSVKQRLRNHCSNKKSKNWGKENEMSLLVANSSKKASGSIHNRFSKTEVSGTTGINRGGQRLSEKVKRNNIVSNVTSFIPLVQQKQAAAVCKGKREIKVRALEAAEAAKRLEEKKENERKIKKEALKLERAKAEQETLRQRELDKKKKEEELKKKDADMAARKRVREDEERKEKERKRKRIGAGWQTHRAQNEKALAQNGEKEKKCGNKGNKMNNEKESYNRTGKDLIVDKSNGDGYSLKIPVNKSKRTGVVLSNIRQVENVPRSFGSLSNYDDSREATSMLDQSPSRISVATKTISEKSYEISPYQPSDDEEEEEEDDLPTKKFVPSWASKNSVALALVSQKQVDPCVIFPRESFCSMNEVLLPRHLN